MKCWAADIGNAYLEATTKEKLCIVAGPEFEELQGHILVIHNALYGLKSSGLRCNRKISMIFSIVSCFSCVNNPSSSQKRLNCLYLVLEAMN